MTNDLPACMGGFCQHRDCCAQHLTERRASVVERLCQRGQESPTPVNVLSAEIERKRIAAERTAEHRRRLEADPRFAAVVAGVA